MSITVLVLVIIEIIMLIGIPVAAVLLLKRKWGLPLSIAIAGAVTFIGSQVLHIPANFLLASVFDMQAQPLIVQAIILGLSAGIFEEVAPATSSIVSGRRMSGTGTKLPSSDWDTGPSRQS